ncbi:MAG: response regulator, partial [Coriobacteriia bacterium]|nr:response regulator [Coriobacteriia bacterium]
MDEPKVSKKHILVVSSEPLVLAEIKKDLIEHFDISIAASIEAALTSLSLFDVAAVVICIGESREKAFAVFHSVYETAKTNNIPIIFLAEKGNDDDETTSFAMGATDYSARRKGALNALISRINLRISASDNEKQVSSGKVPVNAWKNAPEQVLKGKTILLADDIAVNREIVSGMLSDIEGLCLVQVNNGAEAVLKYRSNPELYSLILMDIQMPEMDGMEATRVIRSLGNKWAHQVPIIALTADIEHNKLDKYLEAGMNDFIAKPMSTERLLAICAEHCLTLDNNNGHTLPDELGGELGIEVDGIDKNHWKMLYGRNKELFISVLRSYADNTPKLLESMREVNEQSLRNYAITVHGLKGSSRTIGAHDIGDKAETLETLSHAGNLAGVLALNE